MRAISRAAIGAGIGAAATPAYLLAGLSLAQAGLASILAMAGCAAALAMGTSPSKERPAREKIAAKSFTEEAMADVQRIRRSARKVDDDRAVAVLLKIADAAQEGISNVLETKLLDQRGRKIVAYYLPQTAKLSQALAKMQDHRSGATREAEAIVAMLQRLEPIFNQFADRSGEAPTEEIARDLSLLEASLKSEGAPSHAA